MTGIRLLLCLILLTHTPAWAETLTGQVVGISDGDTLTLLIEGNKRERIRLSGIDAPEKKQPFGEASRQHLAGMVFGQAVTIEYNKRDHYGRIVGQVWVDGKDACLAQIEAGLAWHYKRFQLEQPLEDRLTYTRAEDAAKSARRGLWTDHAPIPPWEWRRR